MAPDCCSSNKSRTVFSPPCHTESKASQQHRAGCRSPSLQPTTQYCGSLPLVQVSRTAKRSTAPLGSPRDVSPVQAFDREGSGAQGSGSRHRQQVLFLPSSTQAALCVFEEGDLEVASYWNHDPILAAFDPSAKLCQQHPTPFARLTHTRHRAAQLI